METGYRCLRFLNEKQEVKMFGQIHIALQWQCQRGTGQPPLTRSNLASALAWTFAFSSRNLKTDFSPQDFAKDVVLVSFYQIDTNLDVYGKKDPLIEKIPP